MPRKPPFSENMADLVDADTETKTFEDLGINDWLINQCKALGLTRPTPIQYHCVPEILKGITNEQCFDKFLSWTSLKVGFKFVYLSCLYCSFVNKKQITM